MLKRKPNFHSKTNEGWNITTFELSAIILKNMQKMVLDVRNLIKNNEKIQEFVLLQA
jgi:hypothetical protein